MRATAQDHEAASAMGVNVNRVFNVAFALASCLGAAAGVMVGIYYNTVYATMGATAGLKGFAACIFGGLTSLPSVANTKGRRARPRSGWRRWMGRWGAT
jgi:branched-chain amino acid transport system permease protein